jgi:hypothetical protein
MATHKAQHKATRDKPMRGNVALPMPAGRHLLPLLHDPAHARDMRLADWDETLRLARHARLLGPLGHRLQADPPSWDQIPARVQGHLQAGINDAAYHAQLVRMELRDLERALPSDLSVTLLKGAAYLLQDLPLARGRTPNDVDLLVRQADLAIAEQALKRAGWRMADRSAYDERYYREWSHELPPLRYPGHPLEVDLHHSITPVTSRTRANDALLFADLRPIPNSRYQALGPLDQIIHAVIHLFQDSELNNELRGLLDLDGLLRQFLHSEQDWRALTERTRGHHASRLLWYALHYCRTWLGTPVPEPLDLPAPPALTRAAFNWVFRCTAPPQLPDKRPTLAQRLARQAGQARYHFRRMPAGLLARHLLHKGWIKVTAKDR